MQSQTQSPPSKLPPRPKCYCGSNANVSISKTSKNMDRPFFTCYNSESKCKYFKWISDHVDESNGIKPKQYSQYSQYEPQKKRQKLDNNTEEILNKHTEMINNIYDKLKELCDMMGKNKDCLAVDDSSEKKDVNQEHKPLINSLSSEVPFVPNIMAH